MTDSHEELDLDSLDAITGGDFTSGYPVSVHQRAPFSVLMHRDLEAARRGFHVPLYF